MSKKDDTIAVEGVAPEGATMSAGVTLGDTVAGEYPGDDGPDFAPMAELRPLNSDELYFLTEGGGLEFLMALKRTMEKPIVVKQGGLTDPGEDDIAELLGDSLMAILQAGGAAVLARLTRYESGIVGTIADKLSGLVRHVFGRDE
jgi:hypothetical protein